MDNKPLSDRISARYRDCATLILSVLSVLLVSAGVILLTILLSDNGLVTEKNANGEEVTYYYLNEEKQYGFHVVEKKLRYFDPSDGHMVTGRYTIDGKEYYFQPENGSLTVNENVKFDDGTSIYYNRYGNPNTTAELGIFTELDGTLALSGKSGKLTGWQTVDGNTYYFQNITGRMLKSETAYIDGKIYTFNENGFVTEVSE